MAIEPLWPRAPLPGPASRALWVAGLKLYLETSVTGDLELALARGFLDGMGRFFPSSADDAGAAAGLEPWFVGLRIYCRPNPTQIGVRAMALLVLEAAERWIAESSAESPPDAAFVERARDLRREFEREGQRP